MRAGRKAHLVRLPAHGPVAQRQSRGLLILVSWVRIPVGPPPYAAVLLRLPEETLTGHNRHGEQEGDHALTGKSLLALGLLVVALAAGCDAGSAGKSPTPYPTLIPLGTDAPSLAPSGSPQASLATPAPTVVGETLPPAPLALPAEFTKAPKGRTYQYSPTSKAGSLAPGAPKNLKFGACGIFMPVDLNGTLWDPTYGDDGQGGPLTQDQLDDLRGPGKVTATLIDETTLQLVTRHGATITFVPHDGARRYKVCA